MFGKKNSFADKMKALQASYAAAVPAKLRELESAALPLFDPSAPEGPAAALADVRVVAHKIAGSAGTFGCQTLSEAARALEDLAETLVEMGRAPTAREIASVRDMLDLVRDAAPANAGAVREEKERPIYVLVQDELGPELVRHAEAKGRSARLFATPDAIEADPLEPPPSAIVVHAAFPRGAEMCRLLAHVARQESRADVPVVFLSRGGDFATRLRAVRAGGRDFMVEPVDPAEVLSRIDALPAAPAFAPFRVLIVEDDGNLALQCANAFDGPGYETRIVEDPATVLDGLETFDPELVIIDVSLKHCSGLDLAKVVWLRPDRADTSIVFLTPGPEFNRELLKIGAPDEFFVPRPLDSLALCSRLTQHLFKVRAGREPPNRVQILACLDRVSAIATATGAPVKKTAAARASRAQQPKEAPRVAPRVLVVDDDIHIVNGIAIKLSEHGIEVLKAFTGEQAFEVAWRERPDLIISDYNMPKGTGEYLLTRLKSTADTKQIPVVILTGRRVGQSKDYALERDLCGRLGAASYLSKPIDFDRVVREIGQLIELPSAPAGKSGARAARG